MDDYRGHKAQADQVKTYRQAAQERLRKQKFLKKLKTEAAKRKKLQIKQQY